MLVLGMPTHAKMDQPLKHKHTHTPQNIYMRVYIYAHTRARARQEGQHFLTLASLVILASNETNIRPRKAVGST